MIYSNQSKSKVSIFHLALIVNSLFYIFTSVNTIAQITYQMPPKEIADLLDAPPTPQVSIDPTKEWMLIQDYPSLISIDELAQPELRLAGIRFNSKNHGPSRSYFKTGLKLLNIHTKKEFKIQGLPDKLKIHSISWSPSGNYIAFINMQDTGQDLWFIDVNSKSAKKLIPNKINSIYGKSFEWLSDNNTLICKLLPDKMGDEPVKKPVPTGPVTQETSGKEAPARTYQDLLKNAYDEALFDYHFQSQLYKVSLDGNGKNMGIEGIIRRCEPSPNGKYILLETVHRPYSYLVPAYRFPYRVDICDLDGNVVKKVADLPLAEEVPIGFDAVPTGPRSFNWRSDMPATLYWVEAQDGGNPKTEAEFRDKIYFLSAPFIDQAELLLSLPLRYLDVLWGNKNLAIVYETWWNDRRIRSWRINPSVKKPEPLLLHDYSWQDRYNDPGDPLMKQLPNGQIVLQTSADGNTIFFAGDGASPEGDRPFIDSYNIAKNESKRLWRSEAPYFERVIDILDLNKKTMITTQESITEPPNYFIRDLKTKELTQITEFPHPTPQLKNVQKELIRYQREDGVPMTAMLYLPANYNPEQGPLPMLMWAYPQEFKSADAAGQVTDSPYRFVRVRWASPLLWLALGYAILDDPTMPIIGEGDQEPNDTYIPQLVASAKAAVDEMVRRGVAKQGHIAIGGHSYGAFMAANLLAHSDLFSAGIARSGAYNRTLTPFGFQAEERTLWQAPQVYFTMSPFMHAEKVNEPILLIHGMADNNSGTFPMQSERFYNALKGLGGTARLVMLPLESHGYRARESIMHMLWEMTNWLEKYIK